MLKVNVGVCEPYGVIPCLGALKVLKVNVRVCEPYGVIPCLGALKVLKVNVCVCVNPMESFHV